MKASKKALNIGGAILILSVLAILWILSILFWRPPKIRGAYGASIREHGFCIIPTVFTVSECKTIEKQASANKMHELMRAFFGREGKAAHAIREKIMDTDGAYTFHNYIWNIRKGSVVTCHSDNNARRFNPGQKHPSYTVLIYPTGGCLGVVPRSHFMRQWFYLYNPIVDIVCNPGDIIVFDAELIHVGGTSCREKENPRIQLKFSHKDDMKVLGYYQEYYKIIDKKNKIPAFISNAQKNMSCMAPIISDLTQSENIKTARGSVEGAKIGWGQRLFSLFFYGDSEYYDLSLHRTDRYRM